jgi:AcrR family transcriptional regulator
MAPGKTFAKLAEWRPVVKVGIQMVVRRNQEMLDGGAVHPTRSLIIAAASNIMKKNLVASFHMDDLLAATGLTRGAMYHHFKNVEDVIDSALAAIYVEGINQNIELVKSVLGSAKTFEQFRDGVFKANQMYVNNESLKVVRKFRAFAMATSTTSGELATTIAKKQRNLTNEYVVVISAAQKQGWTRSDIEPEAVAIFIQAYSFGFIIDDVSENHIEKKTWSTIIESFFENCVFAK